MEFRNENDIYFVNKQPQIKIDFYLLINHMNVLIIILMIKLFWIFGCISR